MDLNNENGNPSSDSPPQEIAESGNRLSLRAAGVLLVFVGAAIALLLYFEWQIARLPVLAQVVYLVPSFFLAALGIGCLRGRLPAYETAKVVFTSFVTILSGLAAAFALLAVLQLNAMIPVPDIPVANIGLAAIVAGLVASAIGRARQASPAQESGFVARKPVVFPTELLIAVCFFLLFDAMSAGNVGAFIEMNMPQLAWLERTAPAVPATPAPATPPTAVQVTPAAPRDPSLPPGVPEKIETLGSSVSITRSGEVFWQDFTNTGYSFGTRKGQFWNPATGELRSVTFPVNIPWGSAVKAMPGGVLFAGGIDSFVSSTPPVVKREPPVPYGSLVLVTAENKAIEGKLNVPRANPALLALSDTRVLVAGGVVAWGPEQAYGRRDVTRTRAMELVTIEPGALFVERLPDLPGSSNTGYALVALADGRVMALGGTASPYQGCWQCTADTFILDLKTRAWAAGPKMTEPRAGASATLLPDGSVLVAGGWTQAADWSKGGPSRTTERWDPHTNTFSAGASLPAGDASQRPLWAPGQEGKLLLIAGGRSGLVQVYDVARGVFRVAGEWWQQLDKFGLVPVVYRGDTYLWLLGGGGPYPVKLRLPLAGAAPAPGPAADFDHKFYRTGAAFVPARGDAPALVLGGAFVGWEPGYDEELAAVDAIWPDGRVESLAPLNEAQSRARAFRLADGVLVAWKLQDGDPPARMSLEWMSVANEPGQAGWVTLDATLPVDAALGPLGDGSLVSVDAGGNVERISVAGAARGKPVLQTEALPPAGVHGGGFRVRGLADGRIIVTGGMQPGEYVALLPEHPSDSNAPDNYVPIGEESPVDTYRIYDPRQKTWHSSAPFSYASGQIAILDDGRVVSYQEAGMKISRADGTAWSDLPQTERAECLDPRDSRLFALEGELFLSGCGNGHTSIVQWFDFAAGRWATIWQVPSADETGLESVRQADGRIVSRQLPDGKRVVLPIQGP